MKIYKVYLDGQNDVINDQIAIFSNLFGINYIETKKRLANGGLVFSGKAIEIVEKVGKLKVAKIKFHIEPKSPYK